MGRDLTVAAFLFLESLMNPSSDESPEDALASTGQHFGQVALGVLVLVVAVVMAVGAAQMQSDVGYSGVGTDFLPWVVAVGLGICGVLLVRQAMTGGYRDIEKPSGAETGDWRAMAWVVAGVAANAALITSIGFILSCALCFVFAVHGLRSSEGKKGSLAQSARDLLTGLVIAAPVYWLFTKLLAVNLPGLTSTGWL